MVSSVFSRRCSIFSACLLLLSGVYPSESDSSSSDLLGVAICSKIEFHWLKMSGSKLDWVSWRGSQDYTAWGFLRLLKAEDFLER